MSIDTKIEWCDATLNPWMGCTKVSPGCKHCYAAVSTPVRTMGIGWGLGQPRRRAGSFEFTARAMNHRAELALKKTSVFPSLCDWLDPEVPAVWLSDFLRVVSETPWLDWLLLTKRPEMFLDRLAAAYAATESLFVKAWIAHWNQGDTPKNVWVGVSAEDDPWAKRRVPELAKIPARVRFVSAEPLIGRIDPWWWPREAVDWLIIGGESTNSSGAARRCRAEWIAHLMKTAQAMDLPVFVKQMGSNLWAESDEGWPCAMADMGAEQTDWLAQFTHPKGGDPAEWPELFRVRQWPAVMVEATG